MITLIEQVRERHYALAAQRLFNIHEPQDKIQQLLSIAGRSCEAVINGETILGS